MSDPFIGEIRMVPYNFAPVGWADCSGQLLAISQNDALFALIGTTYGGDGITTFALPNLQSRAAIHFDSVNGTYQLGEQGGVETVTLTTNQLPAHNHDAVGASTSDASIPDASKVWGLSTTALYATAIPVVPGTGATPGAMAPDALSATGGSQPHDNQPPFLVIRYIICLEGIFPSSN